ncbi:MAG: hypothetical protein JSS02_00805, partial [Planctomycetes bacterium]|nr:hypothetical protein [Planctomycetota bacterium]
MQLHPLKLVTIVTEQVTREQIVKKILEFGAVGCTWSESQGVGARGVRSASSLSGNVRIEVACAQPIAEKILTYVSRNYFEHYACIAWQTDISVVRGVRYVGSEA